MSIADDYNSIDMGDDWEKHTIFTDYGPVPAGILFMGGMEREDVQDMIAQSPNGKEQILFYRKQAGDFLTKMNITPRMATQTLINKGAMAYADGCREPWAIYAHKKMNSKSKGCFIAIGVALVIIYFLFIK